MNDNPLLNIEFRVPFDRIRAGDIEPALEALLADARERLDAVSAAQGEPAFDATMRAYDAITERLDYAFGVVRHLESVATTPDLRAVYNRIHGPVSAFYSNLPLHEGLWKAVKRYAASEEAANLTGARRRFVDKTVESFRRHGADLDAAGKERLAAIDLELAALTTKFSENVLDSTNAFELRLTEEAQLAGLPPSAVESARENAQAKGLEGWRFTLQGPSYAAVMTYLDDAATREQVYRAFSVRASREPHDNRTVAARILELRRQKASLLGFADFSDFVLEDRMAGRGERAWQFLRDLRQRTETAFRRENESLEAFRGAPLAPWDIGYWAEKERKALYDFDEEILRPYFPLEPVVAGMFDLFGRLFSIDVTQVDGVPAWDPAVRFYEIHDRQSGALLGGFYADFYPRENKRGGAWMDSLLTGQPGGLPHLGLICGNLTPPSGGKPALLTHRDVETIFHEFGHLLHHCLSRVELRGFAGTSVAWDFVELPSQIMENWCWERESLDLFARHYETGEMIPQDLFERMKRARTYRAGNAQMRQLGFGVIDLALHREYDAARDGDVVVYARRLLQEFSPAPLPDEHAMVAAFTHLFSSPVGYGAGYYSYKWAEVLDADAFTRFRDAGVFDEEAGRAFRDTILARGDSEDPAALFRAFMGRDPDPDALLERSGLLA